MARPSSEAVASAFSSMPISRGATSRRGKSPQAPCQTGKEREFSELEKAPAGGRVTCDGKSVTRVPRRLLHLGPVWIAYRLNHILPLILSSPFDCLQGRRSG